MSYALPVTIGNRPSVSAAQQTWTGEISDSKCGATHKRMNEHGNTKMSDRECTLACVKEGAKYVFVSGGKVYAIENQGLAALAQHAGDTVKLSGQMTGETILVSGIEAPNGKTVTAK